MENSELIDEVLELTLAYQQGDATAEERARLERLLADHPQAIAWYLRVVEDTLRLRSAAAASETSSPATAAADESLTADRADRSRVRAASHLSAARDWRSWAAPVAAACLLAAVAAALSWWSPQRSVADATSYANGHSARVVSISNVEWSDGAKVFDEWSFVAPGESLKFETGLVNLFLANGAELLIEGPADVDFVSLQKVFARKGKLAARVGPGAIGFRIETPHANVIDRGTAFGLSVDEHCRTAVVVYEGIVDLDVLGDRAQPRRRLETWRGAERQRKGRAEPHHHGPERRFPGTAAGSSGRRRGGSCHHVRQRQRAVPGNDEVLPRDPPRIPRRLSGLRRSAPRMERHWMVAGCRRSWLAATT